MLSLLLLTASEPLAQSQDMSKILFDQTHNEYWESTIEQGYADLAEELGRAGFEVESLKSGSITYEKISQYNVLAITAPFTPPKPLTSDEISAIRRFVSEGHGLFLASSGWSWVAYTKQDIDSDPANQIGREFGITVNNDIIYDPTNNEGNSASPLFSRFASHPITAGLNIVWGATPSSLNVFGPAQSIVWGDEDAYARGDLETYPMGSKPPLVAVSEFGRGRVVYVGSDGMFHAAPYRPDRDNLRKYNNLKFAINSFKWLSSYAKATYDNKIVSVVYPSQVNVGQSFAIGVHIQYSFSTSTKVMLHVYEHAGPLLVEKQDSLLGSDSKSYSFTLTGPSSTKTWQLNIHAFYFKTGDWVQSDIKSVYISVVSTSATPSITRTTPTGTTMSRPDYIYWFLIGVFVAVTAYIVRRKALASKDVRESTVLGKEDLKPKIKAVSKTAEPAAQKKNEDYERYLRRLKELRAQGKISEMIYRKLRKEYRTELA